MIDLDTARAADLRASLTNVSIPALSPRETQCLLLLCAGATNVEIAADLEIKCTTVKNYLASLYEKIGVRNRTEAAIYGIRQGLA